jgi:hypothetical protein
VDAARHEVAVKNFSQALRTGMKPDLDDVAFPEGLPPGRGETPPEHVRVVFEVSIGQHVTTSGDELEAESLKL